MGSNRHFFRFWREMREDRREKSGDGHTPQNRASNRRKSIFEVLQMDVFHVNWDSVPEVMNKEQFFRICHISKSTALHLLKSGKVPCEWSGKKTRCYKIRKEDVKAYLEERAIFPELYSAPKDGTTPTMWRGSPRSCRRTRCGRCTATMKSCCANTRMWSR